MKRLTLHIFSFPGLLSALGCLLVSACTIRNDIPYPIVEGAIEAIEVEGQCDADGNATTKATISKNDRKATLYVDDTVDLSNLRITRLTVSNEAKIRPDSLHSKDAGRFPTVGFESADALTDANTRIDFRTPATFTLRTYQDYEWKVSVTQVINRDVRLEGQTSMVADPVNCVAVVYVAADQPLNAVKVESFKLGGPHGKVYPDPTGQIYDFTTEREFLVTHGWEEASHKWKVNVYHQVEGNTSAALTAFAMSTQARLTGEVQNGKQPVVEYKKAGEAAWTALPETEVVVAGTSYAATLKGLTPGADYECRMSVDGNVMGEQAFTTAAALPLTDASFDNWHQVEKLWNPWTAGGTAFWDTGNRGATTVGDSNSVPTSDDTCNGSGMAAVLESKWIVLKFAAGNIFTGDYVKTVGTNGVLNFGRPFESFPSKLRVNYKYTCMTIDKVGDEAYGYLKGRPDSCHIYIALTDWDQPREIRTRPSERQLFDKEDTHIIAYGELIRGESVPVWTRADIELNYRAYRRPKYILVVASSSKYGDFFTGGVGSKMWVDNFELIYD